MFHAVYAEITETSTKGINFATEQMLIFIKVTVDCDVSVMSKVIRFL